MLHIISIILSAGGAQNSPVDPVGVSCVEEMCTVGLQKLPARRLFGNTL